MEVPRMEEALNVPGKEENEKIESHMTSAADFVDGGIQDACDNACSICLEEFGESDPSMVTGCKHDFHLQCILEWCQRSSLCPMCWQTISLKDPTSQELLEAVERERKFRFSPSRNATIFHHPTLGDFELQHVPVVTNNPELEERIIQHLAAAAIMGSTHHFSRRDQRTRSAAHGRPQFLVFSTHPNATSTSADEALEQTQHLPSVQSDRTHALASGSTVIRTNHQEFSFNKRYKDSISKSTKGWKERFFSRSSSMAGPEVPREVAMDIYSTTNGVSRADQSNDLPVNEQSVQLENQNGGENPLVERERPSSCSRNSAST